MYTKEEALAKCSSNGNREKRMVLTKPTVRLVGDDKIPTLQKFEEKYSEDELILDCMTKKIDDDDDDAPWDEDDAASTDTEDSDNWLDFL